MTLEMFLKYLLPWIVAIIGIVVGYVKLQERVKSGQKALKVEIDANKKSLKVDIESNKNRINEHHGLLTSGIAGGAPFITEGEHDKLQSTCQGQINDKIKSIVDDIGEMKDTMKQGDECRKDARVETAHQFSALRKEFKEFYSGINEMFLPLVKQTAVNESEIKHLLEKVK